MPRAVKNSKIDTRSAREKLKVRAKPYFWKIDHGLHLGYRKAKRGGRWIVRAYVGHQKYKTQVLGKADDHMEADGHTVLDYSQAMDKAREIAPKIAAEADGRHYGPYTVSDALDHYLKENLGREGRDTKDSRQRIERIRQALGTLEAGKLTSRQIANWHEGMASSPPLYRNGKPKPVDMKDPEVQRQRKDSANRYLTVLKAALNHAFTEGRITSDSEWRKVKPFRNTTKSRARSLETAEIRRLINACPTDLRHLVEGALLTGARYGDLTRLKARDYHPDAGAVMVDNKKGGRGIHTIYLSEEGNRFFDRMTAGLEPDDLIFTRADGGAWLKDHVHRPLRRANEAAKIDPPATFHVLRHTYASHAVMNGVPLLVVAQNLGHSDTRMVERHYGHLAESYRRERIMSGLPTWGVQIDDTVQKIR